MNKIPFYHVNLNILKTQDVISEIERYFSLNVNHTVFFLNANCFNLAAKDLEYRKILNNSNLVLNDGAGIDIAAWFAGIKIKENLNGTDLIPKIIKLAYDRNMKLFLLGSKKDVVNKAKISLENSFIGIQIVGSSSGYFDDDIEIIDRINNSRADILIVGMGVPLQEKWITKNLHAMEYVKVSIAGGAIIDFLSGRFKRAPLVVQKFRLEWLFRFVQEPKRLFKRYFLGNCIFFINLIKLRK